jgi:glutamyl endopeptidase
MVYPNGDEATGSGAMIDTTHVLTVAHNVYDKADGGWARTVIVTPGRSGETSPLGTYLAVRETIYTDYAVNETHGGTNFNFDVALLRLNTAVVPGVGALGQAVQPDAYFRGAPVTTSGYPGDLPAGSPLRGSVMYTASGLTTSASSHIIHYPIATASGQSGSPLYLSNETGTYIEGVVSYGVPVEANPAYDNGAVRLTAVVAADLKTWGEVDSVDDPSTVFAHAALPHDPTTFRVSTPYSPQALMHVITT